MKIPTPIVVPMTMQMESNKLSWRGSSDGFWTEVAEVNYLYIGRGTGYCQHPEAFSDASSSAVDGWAKTAEAVYASFELD
jgi:hypothetical protein